MTNNAAYYLIQHQLLSGEMIQLNPTYDVKLRDRSVSNNRIKIVRALKYKLLDSPEGWANSIKPGAPLRILCNQLNPDNQFNSFYDNEINIPLKLSQKVIPPLKKSAVKSEDIFPHTPKHTPQNKLPEISHVFGWFIIFTESSVYKNGS
jgi:hypothetical protein